MRGRTGAFVIRNKRTLPLVSHEILEWLEEGERLGATHMMVVCDTFDHEDYPIYVMPHQNIHDLVDEFSRNMQRVEEIYSFALDLEQQLNEFRAFHY